MRPLVAVLLLALSCGPQVSGGTGLLLCDLEVSAVSPLTWLPGTRVVIQGKGFVPPLVGAMTATLVGRAGSEAVGVRVDLAFEGPERASFTVTPALLQLLPVDGEPIVGQVAVERHVGGGAVASLDVTIRVVSAITPKIEAIGPAEAWPGEEMVVSGDGFLLPGEGVSVLSLSGTWSRQGVLGEEKVDGLEVPLTVTERGRGTFVMSPDLFFGPGVFAGAAVVTNRFASGGEAVCEAPVGCEVHLRLPYIEAVSPTLVRRGQVLLFKGRGFLKVDAGLAAATFVAFTGEEVGAAGTVAHSEVNPLVLVPDFIEGNTAASLVLRVVEGVGGKASGLAASPVQLNGTFRPHVLGKGRVLVGQGLDASLTVGPQVQVVVVRFLPTTRQGLAAFGLAAVAEQVEARVLEVCRGDYARWAVEFRTERPDDYAEYTTVEVMGRDPNKAGLLGLDSTFGKDVGNLRFDDLIGGYSAESEAAGYYPYGGVFVESFLQFSRRLSADAGPGAAEMASDAFDAVFGPFAPALGGKPATGPDDPRAEELALAIWVLGNLIGDTVSHELGHALGLAAFPGDFHDPGDNPGSIMDAGAFRPFEERAQLPGAAPRHFILEDAAYLDEILPKG